LLASGTPVKFNQEKLRVRFQNLPAKAPDSPVTTIAIECDGEPKQDNEFERREHERLKA
jgi:alpha-L-fucosidase